MSGNKISVIRFLFERLGKIKLRHIGILDSIGAPQKGSNGFVMIKNAMDILRISPPDSRKKADVYLNGLGVSIKQAGGSFAFNRIQRANIEELFEYLGFSNIHSKLYKLDVEVERFHNGQLTNRNRPRADFFEERVFKQLIWFLMMKGSPNLGISQHPAELILEAPLNLTEKGITVYSFSEYFKEYKNTLRIAIRRQWVGQASNSGHRSAKGLCKKSGNMPWVFEEVVGNPRSGWREDVPKELRKTAYFLMIEKI